MSGGHTPGEWASAEGTTTGRIVIAPGEPKVRRNVAACGGPNREANARLIAAAPDLLEALEGAAQTFRRYEEMHAAKGSIEGDMKARANAEKAERYEALIAKARGQ